MSRIRLRSSDQPLLVRWLLGLYEFAASLKLAVLLITSMVVMLIWATFIESYFGAPAARFGIYGTWWFLALNALLGMNVLCAALIRFPWKKHQTGFVITHAGILVLLFGCYLSYRGGIDAQLPVYEQESAYRAYELSQRLQLTVLPAGGGDASGKVIEIPFDSGPFNWSDYGEISWHPFSQRLFWFPWWFAHRDSGVVYDRDGVRLEVLDYDADCERLPVPRVTLRARPAKPGLGMMTQGEETVELAVRTADGNPHLGGHRFGLGDRRDLEQGQRVVFWMTGEADETQAFLHSAPEGPLGDLGQIVVDAGGKTFRFQVDALQQGQRMPLGDTGLSVALASVRPEFPGVQLDVHRGNDPPETMFLLADRPDMNQHDSHNGVYGAYWVDVSADGAGGNAPPSEMRQVARRPRIDILQGADGKLYYRSWHAPELDAVGELPADGGEIVAWKGPQATRLAVTEFLSAEEPGRATVPLPFRKDKNPNMKQQRAQLRLTVDGKSDTFWLLGFQGDPEAPMVMPEQRKTVAGRDRQVAVMMPRDSLDIGFRVFLRQFNRKLDPGTSQASHYSSNVSFRDRNHEDQPLQADEPEEGVLITLNQPVNFTDPASGRSYRLYQESFAGPYRPGDPEYDQIVAGRRMADQLFVSFLSVNYDPGRGLKYGGCLMIVVGIAVMFWMKAYFFPKRKSHAAGGEEAGQPAASADDVSADRSAGSEYQLTADR